MYVCMYVCMYVWRPFYFGIYLLSSRGNHLKYNYIHNSSLEPFSQDYGLAPHTTHVVSINFIRERLQLQFKVDSEQQIFETIWDFHDNFINFALRVFVRNLLKGNRPRNIFFFIIGFDTWPRIWTRTLRLIRQHITY